MKSDDEILEMVRQDRGLAELLWEVCEFDLTRGDHGEPVRLSSGHALEGIAGDFTGGTFFLCGERRSIRPVFYASSEGQAGLIGHSLAETLEVVIGLPSWWDCLKFSGGGDLVTMQSAVEHLQRDELRDQPELAALRVQLATTLSLDLATVPVLLARLRDAVAGTTPDFVLTIETGEAPGVLDSTSRCLGRGCRAATPPGVEPHRSQRPNTKIRCTMPPTARSAPPCRADVRMPSKYHARSEAATTSLAVCGRVRPRWLIPDGLTAPCFGVAAMGWRCGNG